MKSYLVTILCDISVEAENEIEAESKALDKIEMCVDSCQVKNVEREDDEDE